jgi:hypothetical protein
MLRVPFAAKILAITYLAVAAITGANTDTRTLTAINKLQAGVGTTSLGVLAFTSGVDAVAHKEKAFTLSATAADLLCAEGDIIALQSAHAGGSGLADPGGVIVVTLARDPSAV